MVTVRMNEDDCKDTEIYTDVILIQRCIDTNLIIGNAATLFKVKKEQGILFFRKEKEQ